MCRQILPTHTFLSSLNPPQHQFSTWFLPNFALLNVLCCFLPDFAVYVGNFKEVFPDTQEVAMPPSRLSIVKRQALLKAMSRAHVYHKAL